MILLAIFIQLPSKSFRKGTYEMLHNPGPEDSEIGS